jgi:SMC interacting uncharacterized protein involved in chromosome segregation
LTDHRLDEADKQRLSEEESKKQFWN